MSNDLLATAELLLSRPGGSTDADACRAASTVYYAMFHCLSVCCCDLFVGPQSKSPPQRAWQHLYRSLSHATISERCRRADKMKSKGFPSEVLDFAQFLKMMQWKREQLDYSFNLSPNVEFIRNDIALAGEYMKNFMNAPEFHRRAFAVYVLFSEDRHEKKIVAT